tara:strand:+ start:102 stop:629 length:528 start_codon:yes stop_codon:yes gene_type:complete
MPEPAEHPELLVAKKLAELNVRSEALFGVRIEPVISFDLKGQAAGQANYRENKIRFNRQLLEKYAGEFVDQTVPHEFAHLVAYQKFGRRIRPHGAEWKRVMEAFGVDPARTHSFDVAPTRRLKRFHYRCHCPGSDYQLSSIRHNRVQRGGIYLCRKCGCALFSATPKPAKKNEVT